MTSNYEVDGYLLLKAYLSTTELHELSTLIHEFHRAWLQDNATAYGKGAVNSAFITSTKYLSPLLREKLFVFLGSDKVVSAVGRAIKGPAAFMSSQLFFNPVDEQQNNYWHRDPQYHLDLDQQRLALQGPTVLHLRIPLVTEPGIEVIPGSHASWDTDEELDVRLERNGHKHHETLSRGKTIPLDAGDVLLFSANMIHRGLYGGERLSFDVLFCEPSVELIQFVADDCLPDASTMQKMEDASAFKKTLALI